MFTTKLNINNIKTPCVNIIIKDENSKHAYIKAPFNKDVKENDKISITFQDSEIWKGVIKKGCIEHHFEVDNYPMTEIIATKI